jgi:disulfide oxidoreductase YuzD
MVEQSNWILYLGIHKIWVEPYIRRKYLLPFILKGTILDDENSKISSGDFLTMIRERYYLITYIVVINTTVSNSNIKWKMTPVVSRFSVVVPFLWHIGMIVKYLSVILFFYREHRKKTTALV